MQKFHCIYNSKEILESNSVLFMELNYDKELVTREYIIEKVGKKNIIFKEKTPLGKSVPITSIGFVYPIEINNSGEFRILGACLSKDKRDLKEDFLRVLEEKKEETIKEFDTCINAISWKFKPIPNGFGI